MEVLKIRDNAAIDGRSSDISDVFRKMMMSSAELEDRVAALESKYAQLLELLASNVPQDGWRTVVGMFADDPDIGSLHQETQRIRDDDRKATRDVVVGES